MSRGRLVLHTVSLSLGILLVFAVQLVVSLYLAQRDDVKASLEQLEACELELPASQRRVVVEERQADIVPDTVDRLIQEVDFPHRSGIARSVQRILWLWLLPQAVSPEQMLGLYLQNWPHPEVRGMCAASRLRFGRTPGELTPGELRRLLGEEEGREPR